MNKIISILVILLFSFISIPSASVIAQQAQATTSIPNELIQASTSQVVPHDLGVNIGWQMGNTAQATVLNTLHHPAIWYNWKYDHFSDPTYLPMAFSMKTADQWTYINAAAANPWHFWLLGNEPEQPASSATPVEAAEFAKNWYDIFTNSFACCGVIWTNLSTADDAWMNSFLTGSPQYHIPPYWHIHIYWVCTPAQWDAEIASFNSWMITHNVWRPVIVSETNAGNNCNDLATQQALMLHINQEVNLNHVYAVMWYTAYDSGTQWNYANLVKKDAAGKFTLTTPLGQTFNSTH